MASHSAAKTGTNIGAFVLRKIGILKIFTAIAGMCEQHSTPSDVWSQDKGVDQGSYVKFRHENNLMIKWI